MNKLTRIQIADGQRKRVWMEIEDGQWEKDVHEFDKQKEDWDRGQITKREMESKWQLHNRHI